MAKVALINLPFQADVASIAQISVGPPMGLAYVAAVLEPAGHEVRIIDANALGLTFSDIVRDIVHFRPEVVGTTAATPSINLAGRLAEVVKQAIPRGTSVVVGGPHGSVLPIETLASFPDIDVVVIGEGELIADALITALAAGADLSQVPSIAYREEGKSRLNAPPPPDTNLDLIPFPARDLLPNHLYRTIDSWPMTCMIAMRGCPAGCIYCNVPELAGRQVRRRSPQNVVAEMNDVTAKWNVRFFSFLDDTFTTSRTWVEQFCETMRAADLAGRVSWSCLTRPDMVDEALLREMKSVGLVRVEFGIESGSPKVLSFLNKGATLSRIREAFDTAKKVGLVTLGFAMVNTPEETPADMDMTLQEVLSIDPDFLQLSFCTPYPGTVLYDYCRKHDLLATEDWMDYRFLKIPVIRNRFLEAAEVEARHREILRRFYLRPKKAIRLMRYALSSPNTAYSLTRSSLQGLLHLARRFR